MDYVPPIPKPGRLWKPDFFKFRTASSEAGENITPLFDPSIPPGEAEEPDLNELNTALSVLVNVFPDVQPEVFREMLISISEDSRLQVVTEHLLQKKAKWVNGRYRTPLKQDSTSVRKRDRTSTATLDHGSLENEDLFRGQSYKKAVKQVFYQEFKNLSHSAIRGVLAEHNFSYTLTRPVLQQLSSRSWRFSLTSFWTKRGPTNTAESHPYVAWQTETDPEGRAIPALKRTGNEELDHELYGLFVRPTITKRRIDRLITDWLAAVEVNVAEAEEAEALFDCECCYTSVPFENIATCNDGCHYLCLDCIRRTVNEALYGQGWARTADLSRSTVRCFATDECHGSMPGDIVRRALTQGSNTADAWNVFQARITSETLLQSGLPLQRCPFCSYAEIDEPPKTRLRHPMAIWHYLTTRSNPATQIIFMSIFTALILFTIPLLILSAIIWVVFRLVPPARKIIAKSIVRIQRHRRGLRFRCQNPSCLQVSCTRCTALWRDPHACFESEKSSLRHAIEASATAAVKRTCPKCMLSFVKSSGCNKLVCNCGYTMCYICRNEITSKEGYGHFCQHFRPSGGRCGECERCDLYGDEDEEAAIRNAAQQAELAWREREGGKKGEDGDAARLMIDALVGRGKKEWYDDWLDALLSAVLA
jgi:hypothetical protein